MPGADVNYLAVLIAAIAVQPLGFLWYGKIFSERWMALRGYDGADHEGGGPGLGYALAFGLSLVEFFVLSYVVDWAFAGSVVECIAIAAFMWLGFVAPVMGMAVIFSDRASFALFAIEGGFQLAALLVGGLVIGLFQPELVGPVFQGGP